MTLSKSQTEQCAALLGETEIFGRVGTQELRSLAQAMQPGRYEHNETVLVRGQPSDRMLVLVEGELKRTRVKHDGVEHVVDYALHPKTYNSMHVVAGDPVYADVKCVSEHCTTFEMHRDVLLRLLNETPGLSSAMIAGLSYHLRHSTRKIATPLLEQHPRELNVPAVTIAAAIESYYRSALNALLNARLTGVRAELFPNMHVQVPIRVLYINGFKGLRSLIERTVQPDEFANPTAVRLAAAVAPGVAMTPVSSILEACNAGHRNPEPLHTRWIRGALPRGLREIIFGIGLNQLSDYFEERLLPVCNNNTVVANAAGSLTAGVISGYLSHVPHNLSTYKLMEPGRSYASLYQMFVDKSVPPIIDNAVQEWSPLLRNFTRAAFATFFPRGVSIRTAQIVGSFMILNGTITFLQRMEEKKIEQAVSGAAAATS